LTHGRGLGTSDFEAQLIEFDGEDDHVHLLVHYPPKVSASNLANSLKGVSSRMIRKKNYASIRKKLWGGALRSPSYCAVRALDPALKGGVCHTTDQSRQAVLLSL